MVVSRLRSIWTVPDLRNKILFTLGMLLIFRIVAYIPVPGIDAAQISKAINSNTNTGLNQIFGLLDVFTGGSLQNFSIVAMGVYPYITASIVVQLLQNIVPRLADLNKEGESGRNRLSQLTRYITVPLALLQAFGQMALLVQVGAISVSQFNLFDRATAIPDAGDALQPDGGYDVPRLARRADYRERHRQRHLTHHLRQHHGQGPADNRQRFRLEQQ